MSAKTSRNQPIGGRHTPPRQFRLSGETLAELDYLQARYGLTNRTDVIRFLARRAALDEKRRDGGK